MTPTRARLDAAEAWLLEEWREWVEVRRRLSSDKLASLRTRPPRDQLATAIRAIRAQRKALDATTEQLEAMLERAAEAGAMKVVALMQGEGGRARLRNRGAVMTPRPRMT